MTTTRTDWRALLAEVPRESFLPDVIWTNGEIPRTFVSVSRAEDPQLWAELVERDDAVIIQVDDGEVEPGGLGVLPTSSASAPSVVVGMLEATDLRPGQAVLEIGTGTGWNAALLSRRIGEGGRVVSIEVDPAVAAAARRALAGYPSVRVITGDGEAGHPPGAPYDRVLATVGVRTVPRAWLAQTRPGGLVVLPWDTGYSGGSLLRLRVAGDGTAAGRFGGYYAFMRLRSQRRFLAVADGEDLPLERADRAVTTVTGYQVYQMMSADQAAFTIGLLLPDTCGLYEEDRRGDYHHVVELHDHRSGSWAQVDVNLDHDSRFDVYQYGSRRLWDEALAGFRWWHDHGEPGVDRYGMTITPRAQTVWLDDPGGEHRWVVG